MRKLVKELENRKIDYEKLISYGFKLKNNTYSIKKDIYNDEFYVEINISNDLVASKVIEKATNDEFFLVDVKEAGSFSGFVNDEYEKVLKEFVSNCTTVNVFKSSQSKKVISYLKEKYDTELEFLWDKYPDAAAFRNKSNNKWYGIFMKISKEKIGEESSDLVDIIDLRYQKEDIDNIIDNKKVFPGYHMNKKSWITLVLDGRMNIKEIYKLIDNSYQIIDKKNK